jgi:putative membrane protein
MSSPFLRNTVIALGVSAICLACGSDQKPAESPDDIQADAPALQPGDAAPMPNGQPVNTPPDGPPPQGLNEPAPGNAIASPVATTPSSTAPALTEPQIAMIADLANTSEVEQGKLAQAKAKNASVKKFAAMMVKHHSEAKTEQAKLFKQLNLTPAQSPKATTLQQDGEKTLTSLRAATGASFDARYIDSQVDAHQKVLDALDNELIPAATDQKLIDGLNKMKATVQSHLQEAKTIQA